MQGDRRFCMLFSVRVCLFCRDRGDEGNGLDLFVICKNIVKRRKTIENLCILCYNRRKSFMQSKRQNDFCFM